MFCIVFKAALGVGRFTSTVGVPVLVLRRSAEDWVFILHRSLALEGRERSFDKCILEVSAMFVQWGVLLCGKR